MLGRVTGNTDTQDSPRLGLGGSHHLPPYSILCSSRRRWHPNGYFSRDSRVGVPKLSRVGVPELWTPISPDCRVWSQRGLKQSCSSCPELSNAVSHSQIGHRKEVDSRLLVFGSQTGSLTPGPSFGHNLCFRCPNEQCEPILDIYVSRAFQWYQESNNPVRFDPSTLPLKFRDSLSQNGSYLGSVSVHSLTLPRTSLNSRECVVTLGLLLGPHPSNAFAFAPGLPSFWFATLPCLCLDFRASFLLAYNLATPCLGREPKARVATNSKS